MQDGQPVFPEKVLLERFSEGSEYQAEIKKMHKAFKEQYGHRIPSPAPSSGHGDGARASGVCDYSIEGPRPIDTARNCKLPCVPIADFGSDDRTFA